MISLLVVQRNETRAMLLEAVYHRKNYREIFHSRQAVMQAFSEGLGVAQDISLRTRTEQI
jgi:hypothetical protein